MSVPPNNNEIGFRAISYYSKKEIPLSENCGGLIDMHRIYCWQYKDKAARVR